MDFFPAAIAASFNWRVMATPLARQTPNLRQTQIQQRRNEMKTLVALMVAVLFAGMATAGVASEPAADSARDGVFVHISHGKDDPHRLLMALNMANLMADDHNVLVYFDINAVNAVLKDSEDVAFAQFPSSKAALAALKAKNVVLMACPGCLKAAGKTEEDLAEGILIADKKAFFSFSKGRILTLDY
jgi:predicted peroxiredoxin